MIRYADSPVKLTVDVPPVVTIVGFCRTDAGEQVDGTFDFRNVRPENHWIILQTILAAGCRVIYGVGGGR